MLLDYTKAFDMVIHDMLLAKLHYYNFSELVLSFFSSYLLGRKQMVELDGARSNFVTVDRGVPQGSILGPLLFNLYTADLPAQIRFCTVHLYADDTQLVANFYPEAAGWALEKINEDLSRIDLWSANNGLRLNVAKCKCMYLLIGSKANINKVPVYNFNTIHINNIIIPQVETAKNLGVVFDSSLNFEAHVIRKISAVFIKLRSLYPLKFIVPPEVKLRLVDTLLLPYLDYCDVLYYEHLTDEYKKKIQKAQNACMRFIYCVNKYDHISPLYVSNNILKMNYRIKLHTVLFIQKILLTKTPSYLYELIIARDDMHPLNLRNIVRFNIPRHNTSKFKHCFLFHCIELLNSPLYWLVVDCSKSSLKNKLKAIYFEEQSRG